MYCLILFLSYLALSSGDNEKPIIYDLIGTKLIEGKKFTLNCILSSGDQASFEWFLNGEKLIANDNIYINENAENSMLNIRSMGLEQAGEFECRASNRFGVDKKTIQIKLEIKPKWLNEPTDIFTRLNSSFSTKCRTTGIPLPITKWEKLSLNGDVEKVFESDVLEFKFTKTDVALYRCTSENKLGKIEKVIRIKYYGNFIF